MLLPQPLLVRQVVLPCNYVSDLHCSLMDVSLAVGSPRLPSLSLMPVLLLMLPSMCLACTGAINFNTT